VATIPDQHRRLLRLPRIPLAVAKPTVASLLGALSLALGPTSPSMRNAVERAERLAGRDQPLEAIG
jgi:hypothetical protein